MKILPIAVMAAATVGCCFAASDWQSEANKRKAEYMMIEAQSAFDQDQRDDYVLLMDKAYALDSTDVDVAGEWAMAHLTMSTPNSEETERYYSLLLNRFYADPANYPQALLMAYIASQLGKFDDNVRIWETIDSLNTGLNTPAEELARAYLIKYIQGDSTGIDKAMAIYDRLEQGTGKTLSLSSMRLAAYMLKEDTAAVVSEIETLYKSAPNDPQTAIFVGNGYKYINQDSLALKYFSLACELDSTLGQAYMAKADLLYQMGDSAAYDREVFRALHSPNLDVEPKVSILTSYVRELFSDPAQEPRIRELFTDLEQMHTGETSIYDLYGSYLYTIKDYKGAAEQASYTLALNPAEDSNWSTLVQMQALARDTVEMIKTSKEAMGKFPDNLYYPIVAAQAYSWREEYGEAISLLNSVEIPKDANPRGVASFYAVMGDIYNLAGDTVQAVNTYLKSLEYEPDDMMILNNAAYFMSLIDKDLDKAKEMSARTIKNDPENPTYLDTYAWVLFKRKEYQEAKVYIDKALDRYSNVVEYPDSTGVAEDGDSQFSFVESGQSRMAEAGEIPDDEEVIEVVEVVEELEPSAEVYEHAGDIYFMCGEPDQALDFWKKALELDPDNALLKKKVKNKTFFYK